MDRRDFVGLTVAGLLGVILGCSRKTETDYTGDAGPPPAPTSPGVEPTDTAPPPGTASRVKCPRCGVDNDVVLGEDGKPVEITCYKCGHKWVPTL